MDKLFKLFHTIRYLKMIQIYYRLYYLFRRKLRQLRGHVYPVSIPSNSTLLLSNSSLFSSDVLKESKFTFLNISHDFDGKIDWNYMGHGKLWTYNLTYFDFLNQKDISKERGHALIDDFVKEIRLINDGMEPYPISLRGINWIKFLNRHKIKEQKVDDSLYAQYKILMDNIEYHLLGNHLLENGFSLLYGAYYFKEESFYTKAKIIITAELSEQILEDGAHFELSPMYHQIMFFRVLDSIHLIKENHWKDDELLVVLKEKASLMLAWLNNMTFKDGQIPLFNDSANGIAPTTHELNEYAKDLQVKEEPTKLSSSGYRTVKSGLYEMMIDVGNIGPDYIPGHAHSDTFNFELYYRGRPIIVDTGLSTYEKNKRRTLERSTASHNTVELADLDQSEVWGGFRVARRAYITKLSEDENKRIEAIHNGYEKRLDVLHQRRFMYDTHQIIITDFIITDEIVPAIARLHFHPDAQVEIEGDLIRCDDIVIKVTNAALEIKQYQYAPRFNTLEDAKVVEMTFSEQMEIEIRL